MHVYDVLKRPVVTEKSNAQAGAVNQYTFEVDRRANKMQVKDAVETAFNVKVVAVNIVNIPPRRAARPAACHQEAGSEEGCRDVGGREHDSVRGV